MISHSGSWSTLKKNGSKETSHGRIWWSRIDLISKKESKTPRCLSPMKPSASGKNSYFEGHLADETSSLRVVGFDILKHQKLAEHQGEEDAIMLEVKKARFGDSFEVVISQSTSVVPSPRKLEKVVPCNSSITLGMIASLEDYKCVNISSRWWTGLEKQDVVLSDATGTARLTLWQENIEVDHSYEIANASVGSYNNAKYLTTSKSGFTVTALDDIGEVHDKPEELPTSNELKDAEVITISHFTKQRACISCKGKVDRVNERIGKCTKCSAGQKIDKSPLQLCL